MVVPPTLGTSCAFTRTIPFLDGIQTNLLCPSMNTLLRAMNSIPKMQSIPPKVKTNKSTLPLQFPNQSGTSFACSLVHPQSALRWVLWARPTGVPFFWHFFWVMKLWEAHVSKRHNTSHLETFPFKKIRRLHSPWAKSAVRAITLEAPLPDLGLRQSLE